MKRETRTVGVDWVMVGDDNEEDNGVTYKRYGLDIESTVFDLTT